MVILTIKSIVWCLTERHTVRICTLVRRYCVKMKLRLSKQRAIIHINGVYNRQSYLIVANLPFIIYKFHQYSRKTLKFCLKNSINLRQSSEWNPAKLRSYKVIFAKRGSQNIVTLRLKCKVKPRQYEKSGRWIFGIVTNISDKCYTLDSFFVQKLDKSW